MSGEYLATSRVLLRWLDEEHLDDLVELDSDPEVVRWVDPPPSREEVEREHIPAYRRYRESGLGFGFWAAVHRESGEFMGWFHLRPRQGEAPDAPELGYRLRRKWWGQGFATEVSLALVERAFRELGASRVWAAAAAENTRSRRVMEKCGLRLERWYWAEEYGCWDVDYGLTREQWEAAAAARAG